MRFKRVAIIFLMAGAALPACVREGDPAAKASGKEIQRMRYEMVEELMARKAYSDAVPYLQTLLAQHPDNARLHLLLGIVLREKGIGDAAEKELRIAIKLNPQDAETANALGVHLSESRSRLPEAVALLRQAVELSPQNSRYYNDLGVALAGQGKLADAAKVFAEAIRRNPDDRRAFNNLGFVQALQGKDDEALKSFAQAGSRAMVLTNMGYAQELKGSPGNARRYYERALKAQREYAPALRNLHALDPSRWPDPAQQSEITDDLGGTPIAEEAAPDAT